MAADFDLTGVWSKAVASSTSNQTVALRGAWSYGIKHTGRLADNTADTNYVAIGIAGTAVTADFSSESNKVILESGQSFTLPAHLGDPDHADSGDTGTLVTIKSAANAPMVEFVVSQMHGGHR